MSKTLWVALCSATLFTVSAAQAQSVLTQHVRAAASNGDARRISPMGFTETLRLDVVLRLRDQAGLDNFLKDISDPSSANYRHFLNPSEFTERFGPSQDDYDALTRYAISNGFKVVGGSRDGMDLQIEGSVSNINTAFHVTMGVYHHDTEDRTFYAPDREPTVDLPFSLWHISGLDNYSIPHPMLVKKSDATARGANPGSSGSHATTGSGPQASFLGSDMRAAYYGTGSLNGAGQNMGLFEYLGTDLADLNTYFANAGQKNNVPIILLSTDGTSTSCLYNGGRGRGSCDDTEQTLDMTQALGMAPGLASLTNYIGSTDTAILSAMTTHSPLPTTISCSWGWTPSDPSTDDPYWQRMAAQGQNFFVASGDSSTWTRSGSGEAWPADDPNIISVGGTDLQTLGPGLGWVSESAWADSGGGISPDGIAIPSYQQLAGVINASNRGSNTLRNGPDVSANANFTYYVCADQGACTANEYGGTSFAAPLWAAYTALINQQAAMIGNAPLGFINPGLYQIGVGGNYNANFHDITSGTSGSYSAVTGYDLVTGWGSPNGSALVNSMASYKTPPSFSLSASTTSLTVPQGNSGNSTISTAASGGFDYPITVSALGQPSGVTVSFKTNPIPAPGSGSSVMTMAVSSSAPTGTYPITVTATGGGITHTVTVTLSVSHSHL